MPHLDPRVPGGYPLRFAEIPAQIGARGDVVIARIDRRGRLLPEERCGQSERDILESALRVEQVPGYESFSHRLRRNRQRS